MQAVAALAVTVLQFVVGKSGGWISSGLNARNARRKRREFLKRYRKAYRQVVGRDPDDDHNNEPHPDQWAPEAILNLIASRLMPASMRTYGPRWDSQTWFDGEVEFRGMRNFDKNNEHAQARAAAVLAGVWETFVEAYTRFLLLGWAVEDARRGAVEGLLETVVTDPTATDRAYDGEPHPRQAELESAASDVRELERVRELYELARDAYEQARMSSVGGTKK